MNKKRKLLEIAVVLFSAFLMFIGVGGYLAVVMIAGNPNPPPRETSGFHALIYAVCAVTGAIGVLTEIVRGLTHLVRNLRARRR
jgi:hypothetical protein